jgi:hypothetical protein
MMRVRILLFAALFALAVPAATSARQSRSEHHRGPGQILGTWDIQVTPAGQPTFEALATFSAGGGMVETESDAPGTAQGSWEKIGPRTYQFAFQTFLFNGTGQPAGHVLVRSQATLRDGTLSGPFKFDVFDTTGHIVQSGAGTATATRFQIPPF